MTSCHVIQGIVFFELFSKPNLVMEVGYKRESSGTKS
jgi:hypothetical protein